jgi:glycerol-3-phosphate dehydrogenase (NAD(P)+)
VHAAEGHQASVARLPGPGDLYVTRQAGRNCRMGRLLGLGLTYSRAKDHMAADTVEEPIWLSPLASRLML